MNSIKQLIKFILCQSILSIINIIVKTMGNRYSLYMLSFHYFTVSLFFTINITATPTWTDICMLIKCGV